MGDIQKMLSEIEELRGQLKNGPGLNEGEEKRLLEQFMVEYTYNSNAIEGSTLTLHETALVVLEGLTVDAKPLKEHLDAIGHRDAFEYIVRIAKSQEPLTERIIKEIHSLVLVNDAQNKGKYRGVSVRILGALDMPPFPDQVPAQMQELLKAYESDIRHPIEKIADFHILFERIHPFIDGNGRVGRLIMNLELIKAGYAPIDVKFKDRSHYIDCFRDYAKTGNSNQFIEMVAKYQIEELKNLIFVLSFKNKTG
ncbi:MAG: Fic family protein [Clostridiales bacterium]|nr:Fic family protein [Clostridiales bacterium]